MRRGQREPFELVEVVETFESGESVGEVTPDRVVRRSWPPAFLADERVRVAVLVLVAIRFGDVAPGINAVFFPWTGSWSRVAIILPAVAAMVGLLQAVLLLLRSTPIRWLALLLIAAADVAYNGVWWLRDVMNEGDFHAFFLVDLLFVTPSVAVLVLGGVAWLQGKRGPSPSIADPSSVEASEVSIDG